MTYGGSFTLNVVGTVPPSPTGQPISPRCEHCSSLDENDMAVKRMQSFLTVQPGETTGCVGCHEQRTETIRPDRNPMAFRRRPSRIEPIDDCPDVFDFPRDIQPILDRHCVDCHGYKKTARGGPYAAGSF